MRTAPGLRAPCLFLFIVMASVLSGCGQPVREDRSIPFSADGNQVGFQHGNEGIFLATPAGGPPRKIYQPPANVSAVSTPLWSPDGKQVVFLTATSSGWQSSRPQIRFGSADDPAGNLVYEGPITYDCWLFDGGAPEGTKPAKLFSAALNHPGYVAANLAVRWHPSEAKLYYLAQVGPNNVGLFEWDLVTATAKQAFGEIAEAMVFDWSPDGKQLACVLGFSQGHSLVDGIWIGRPSMANWWHVPSSEHLAKPELTSVIEALRASRPVFTADGARFAFVTSATSASSPPTVDNAIHVGTIDQQTVTQRIHGVEGYRDLHWRAGGKELGFVQGNQTTGTLHVASDDGSISAALNQHPVRQFAGWNFRGDELAYTSPERVASQHADFWSFLLIPDLLARDVVMLRHAGKSAKLPESQMLDGMRVTFPQWSPNENKLSLWLTFSPPYRSWFWFFFRSGLRPGDPAAVFDTESRKTSWLAINDYEKTQVGRYHHLKRNYQEAWNWYEQGKDAGMPSSALAANLGLPVANEQFFYEYLCLEKLGHKKEAEARLERFEACFLPTKSKEGTPPNQQGTFLPEVVARIDLFRALTHDFLIAEAYLSLDLPEDAETFFRAEFEKAKSDDQRLSALIALGQILLIEGKNVAYHDLCLTRLAALLAKDAQTHAAQAQPGSVIELLFASALLPLVATDFVANLPREIVQAGLPDWRKLAQLPAPRSANTLFQFILLAALERLGEKTELAELKKHLERTNAALAILPPAQRDTNKGIKELRTQLQQFLTGF
ncbi:hypothetical protein BH10PLA2_BH10PLA2_16980 [soil metagenome]